MEGLDCPTLRPPLIAFFFPLPPAFFFWLPWVFTGVWGLSAAACEGFSLVVACRRPWWQKGFCCEGSGVAFLWLIWLQLPGLVALRPDLSSPARGGIPVPCMGRQILHHWTSRGELPHTLLRFRVRPRCGRSSALTPSRPPALPPPALPGPGPGRWSERRVQPLEDLAIFRTNRRWRCRRRQLLRQGHGGVPGKEEVQKIPLDILCNVFTLFPRK